MQPLRRYEMFSFVKFKNDAIVLLHFYVNTLWSFLYSFKFQRGKAIVPIASP